MKNLPQDFYFEAFTSEDELGISCVVLTTKEFWDKNGYWDDSLGSHKLSEETKKALDDAGIFSKKEAMEAIWQVIHDEDNEPTKEEVVKRMISVGFIHNHEMDIA